MSDTLVEMNETVETISLASGAGYRCFTAVAAFQDYIEREILSLELQA